jgi:mutator protein MutT
MSVPELRQATLCFLVRPGELLLAMKKRGFGVGKWNGYGGKLQPGETLEQAAQRELTEESGVSVATNDLLRVARLEFYFPHQPNFDQEVHVYLVREWQGEPVETEEMKPKWFALEHLPYSDMWVDDPLWLPQVLQGKVLEAEFYFNDGATACDKHNVRILR